MFARFSPNVMLRLKAVLYWIVFLPAALPYWSMGFAESSGYYNAYAWWGLLMVFGALPILDHIIGKDPANPNSEQEEKLNNNKYYRLIPLCVVPAQIALLVYGAHIFTTTPEFSLLGQVGWVLSVGIASAILAINVGHELIHKDSTIERWAGGFLYASVFYGGFKVEHVRGHHVNVSTPKDASSARYGQNLYHFLPRSYWHNFISAWRLEIRRLKGLGLPAWHYRNELIWWYGLSLCLAVLFFYQWGSMGLVFFLGNAWMSFTTLEIINYVEHYGLHRRLLSSGKYERTTPAHSWNSNYLLSNMGLFHLQRHSDHHAHPKRRYQVLRHFDQSPQLPSGYPGMYVLALIPPLWFKVMNPRVKAYYKGEEHQLNNKEFDKAAGTYTV